MIHRHLATPLTVLFLLPGCFFMDVDLPPTDDPIVSPPPILQIEAPVIWPLKNVFDQQTGVRSDVKFTVRGVHFSLTQDESPEWVSLVRENDGQPHPVRVELVNLNAGTMRVVPIEELDADTHYLLAFPGCRFMPYVRCPEPIRFFTGTAPRVIGLWRTQQTLVVVFSEPMDPNTLNLGHGMVDMVFQQDGQLVTVATDLNLADFVWEGQGHTFVMAPITDRPFDLIIGPEVFGLTGAPPDIDGDGLPDPGQIFVHPVVPELLETCHVRPDFPDPCITPEAAAVWHARFENSFFPELDVP